MHLLAGALGQYAYANEAVKQEMVVMNVCMYRQSPVKSPDIKTKK